jgi:Fic family protein
LYSYPYIKIKILEENNIAKRQTASDYLKKLEKAGLLEATKIGKETYYINKGLMAILSK